MGYNTLKLSLKHRCGNNIYSQQLIRSCYYHTGVCHLEEIEINGETFLQCNKAFLIFCPICHVGQIGNNRQCPNGHMVENIFRSPPQSPVDLTVLPGCKVLN